MDQRKQSEYFSSIVVSVNKFLAPFERIVDYRVIDREFDSTKGELTPKGTYKRRVIENNFSSVIEPMYGKKLFSILCDDLEVRIPNWFLREKGVTSNELCFRNSKIGLMDQKWELEMFNRSIATSWQLFV